MTWPSYPLTDEINAWVYYELLIASRPVIVWHVVAIVINPLGVGA